MEEDWTNKGLRRGQAIESGWEGKCYFSQ